MIRVLLVDDQSIIRAGLRTIIDAHPSLSVVGDVADGFEALSSLASLAPDVVLMDLNMPGISGVEATRRIRAVSEVRILVLTTFDQDENVLAALRAGADGFLSKGTGPTELTDAIVRVADGGRVLSPNAVAAVVEHVAYDRGTPSDPEIVARFTALTAREWEIVRLIVSGLDNHRIAEQLVVSPFTVKTHANRAMAKVGARDRAQLVSLAVRAGARP